MANTRQILLALSREFGLPFETNKFILYSPFFKFYVQGIAVEQTGRKREVYLRKFCTCFFKKCDFIHVSYSPRLESCEEPRTLGFTGSNKDIQSKILDRLGDLEIIPAILEQFTAQHFLKRFEGRQPERHSALDLFDLAASAVLADRLTDAERYLTITRQLVQDSSRNERSNEEFLMEIDALQKVLSRGKTAATAFLARTSANNAEMLGFKHAPPALMSSPS